MSTYVCVGFTRASPCSVPFGPINNIQQTFAHPQVGARQATVEVDVRIALNQLVFSFSFCDRV